MIPNLVNGEYPVKLLGVGKARNFKDVDGYMLIEEGPLVFRAPNDFFHDDCMGCGCKGCKWTGQNYRMVYPCKCKICSKKYSVKARYLETNRYERLEGGEIRILHNCPDHQTKKQKYEAKKSGEVIFYED